MAGTARFVIAAVVAGFNQAACAQHGDFAPKVQMILDYLKDSGERCISQDIPGTRSLKACREGAEPVMLTVVRMSQGLLRVLGCPVGCSMRSLGL
jgi:hypothetical protein